MLFPPCLQVRQNPTSVFLASLATADLLLLIVCLPLKMAKLFTFSWQVETFRCTSCGYIIFIFIYSYIEIFALLTFVQFDFSKTQIIAISSGPSCARCWPTARHSVWSVRFSTSLDSVLRGEFSLLFAIKCYQDLW